MPHLSGEKKRLPDKNLAKKRQNQLRNENLIEWDVRFLNKMMIKIYHYTIYLCIHSPQVSIFQRHIKLTQLKSGRFILLNVIS